MIRQYLSFLMAGLAIAIAPQPGWADEIIDNQSQLETETQTTEVSQPATTVDQWVAQIEASLVQITDVRVETTETGFQVVLETADGSLDVPETRVVGNALIADIANAAIAQEFSQANPIEGIALVEVTGVAGDRVRVAITGTDVPPVAEIRSEGQQLVLEVAIGSAVEAGEEEAIQVVVTGEQDEGYNPSSASTATRTDTPLRDTPRSIQVIPQEVLQDQAINRITDASRNVSSVVQSGGFGGTSDQLSIRGFSGAEILEDGFRAGRSGFSETVNIERIEILKGPAAILAGNVEPGGVINLITEQPLEDPFYEAELQVGDFGFVRPTLDLTGPLTDDRSLLYRLNLAYEYSDGFRDFDQNVDRIFISPVLTWRISDATSLTFDLTHLRDDRPFDRGLLAIGRDIVDIPVERFLGEPNDNRSIRATSVGYRFEHQFSEDWVIRNRFRFFSDNNFDFRAEPLRLNEETGDLARNFRSNDDYGEVYNLQTEMTGQFSTGAVDHNLLVAVDLRRDTSGGTQRRLPDGLTPDINIYDPDYDIIERPDLDELTNEVRNDSNRTDALGILLQGQVIILDNLKLLLSGRFEALYQQSRDNPTGIISDQDVAAFSPTIGLVYQPIEPISLYVNYARSFQPNFGTRVDGSFLEPERGTQYEIGVRAELDDQLVATLAAYHITKSNVATTDPDNSDFSISAGEQRGQGIELDIAGEILSGWNVIASYGYIDAEVTESNDLPEGSRIANIPEHTASLWTTYEIQSGNLQGLGIGLGLFYIGERAGDFEDTYDLPDYLRADASIFYRRDNWRAAINVQNLFNERYFKGVNFGRVAIEPGAPFTIVGSISWEF